METVRYQRCDAGVPNDRASRQDCHVAAHDRQHRARAVHPCGAIELRDGAAVNGANDDVSDGIHRREGKKQAGLLALYSAGHEDGSDEKQGPLQIERSVHQLGQQESRPLPAH